MTSIFHKSTVISSNLPFRVNGFQQAIPSIAPSNFSHKYLSSCPMSFLSLVARESWSGDDRTPFGLCQTRQLDSFSETPRRAECLLATATATAASRSLGPVGPWFAADGRTRSSRLFRQYCRYPGGHDPLTTGHDPLTASDRSLWRGNMDPVTSSSSITPPPPGGNEKRSCRRHRLSLTLGRPVTVPTATDRDRPRPTATLSVYNLIRHDILSPPSPRHPVTPVTASQPPASVRVTDDTGDDGRRRVTTGR